MLRLQLRLKLRQLRSDDLLIHAEGVDSLSDKELQQACRERGMRALGLSVDQLRGRLRQWCERFGCLLTLQLIRLNRLDMQFNEKVPVSLILLSRILYLPENLTPKEQIKVPFFIQSFCTDLHNWFGRQRCRRCPKP